MNDLSITISTKYDSKPATVKIIACDKIVFDSEITKRLELQTSIGSFDQFNIRIIKSGKSMDVVKKEHEQSVTIEKISLNGIDLKIEEFGKFNIKIFGGSDWPVVQYAGKISNENVKHAFRSATVCPNVSEPHSQDFGYDIIERPFKVLMSGGFCISDYVESMANDVFTNDEVLFAKTPEEFEQLIQYYVNHPKEAALYAEKGFNCVLQNHTYFH